MENILEKMLKLDEEDKYDPERNLRSEIIEMFYKEGFSLEGEQRAATVTHFEFKKDDAIIKVQIPLEKES